MTNTDTKPPQPTVEEKKKGGWMKWVLIGCSTLIILGILCGVGCYFAAKYFVQQGTEKIMELAEQEIFKNLPEGAKNKEELKKVFKEGFHALKEGNISTEEISTISDILADANSDGEVNEEEVQQIIKYMQAAAKDKETAIAP